MTKFNPKEHLIDLRGKAYLPVNQRLVWFREDHPAGSIQTDVVNYTPLVVQARIYSGEGVLLATGHGSANIAQGKTVVWSGREIEKAETAAIGRALGHAGYGTQFDNDDDDLDNLADSPIEFADRPAKPKAEKSAADKVMGNGHNQPRNLVQNATDPLPARNSGIWEYDLPALMSHPDLNTAYPQYTHRANAINLLHDGGFFANVSDLSAAVKVVLNRPDKQEAVS